MLVFLLFAAPSAMGGQAALSAPAETLRVGSSPQLFAVMCAMDAAGYGADASTLAESPKRAALREELLALHGPATEALREFYQQHELSDPGETLSRYISFALVVGPPPKFPYRFDRSQLPPDVLTLEGFRELLSSFYEEAQLNRKWTQVAPDYDRAIQRYEGPVRNIIFLSTSYLREMIKPGGPRTFSVLVEPLVGRKTNFRNYGDQYAIVVGSRVHLFLGEIRHAYLHFLLDPLTLRYRPLIEGQRALLNIAARAPRLPVVYQQDFFALWNECLVKAVELRLQRLPPSQLDSALTDADRDGFILVRPLVRQLKKFEEAEPAMHYYFPELVRGIDVAAEQTRLQNIQFTPARAREVSAGAPPGGTSASELDEWLAEGERQIAMQDAAAATTTFERILRKYPGVHRAVYGLAIASVLAGRAERAKQLFEQVISGDGAGGASGKPVPRDALILAWSHVYLGRIHDLEAERELALSEYRAALAVEGAPEAARVAAQHGLVSAYRAPAKGPQEDTQHP